MEWFKVYADLKGHPKRYRFEAACGTKHGLHYIVAFWSYVAKYAPDGDLTKMTPHEIAGASEWQGDAHVFFSALVQSGLIDEVENGFHVHDWVSEHKRFLEENNKRRELNKPKGYPRVTQGLPAKTQGLPSLEENRIEEKEEKRKNHKPLSANADPRQDADFMAFWKAWPKSCRRGSPKKAHKAWVKHKPPLQDCLDTLAWKCKSKLWTDIGPDGKDFIPMPSSWIGDWGWQEEKESGRGNGRGDGYAPPKYDDF